MKRSRRVSCFTPEFVVHAPDNLQDGVLYVSMNYSSVIHNCACGCGQETVTPLSPIDWKLAYDGKHITLHPSIGNWSLPCKSHYYIRDNRVEWATRWGKSRIETNRREYLRDSALYYGEQSPAGEQDSTKKRGLRKLLGLFNRR